MSAKISALSAASALDGTEALPVVQSSTTKKALISAIRTYLLGLANTWALAQTFTLAPVFTDPRGSCKAMGTWFPLTPNGVQGSSLTGSTAETVLNGGTVTIPAGAMGANGCLRVRATVTCTGSSNNKTLRVRLGGLTGDIMHGQIFASSFSGFGILFTIQNRNSQSSQIACPQSGSGWGGSTSGLNSGTKDTSGALDLVVTGELANSGEFIRLESLLVEVFYQV